MINKRDTFAFEHWPGIRMPELAAYRYVCIPHTPGFWDHIVLRQHLANTQAMFAADMLTPTLFNVNMGSLSLHWCCFVFDTQTIMTAWCSGMGEDGQMEVVPITDRTDTRITRLMVCDQFNSMLYYLHRWLCVHYGKGECQTVQVVFDCMPSEGLTVAHFISTLAAKIGLIPTEVELVAAGIQRGRPQTDLNYAIDTRYPKAVFHQAPLCLDGTPDIDIAGEFGAYHSVAVGMTQLYTNNDRSMYT